MEPSGLAFSHKKNALWTVSDDTNKIFKLSLDGVLKKRKSFKIPDTGLEGIVLDPSGDFLFAVKEEHNEIIKIDIKNQQVIEKRRLEEITGYDAVAQFFNDAVVNKGLEGITWDRQRETIFVLKEGEPGLLVEVSPDLQTIHQHQLLNDENGFLDTDVSADEIDFSDICYDQSRKLFWIVSDKARRLYLYDLNNNTVIQSAKLGYALKGRYQEIEKAEGVAIDPDTNRLYLVSDEHARLYAFDIRE